MSPDRWAEWLLERRHGGDLERRRKQLEFLGERRDIVLDHAGIKPGDTVLDIGCGDGLLGLGALERIGPDGRVIFSDHSADLLERCREPADASVHMAMTRSVGSTLTTSQLVRDVAQSAAARRAAHARLFDKRDLLALGELLDSTPTSQEQEAIRERYTTSPQWHRLAAAYL